MKYRDFEPRQEYEEYCLGLMIHDDGDVIKWDLSNSNPLSEFKKTPGEGLE